MSTLFTVKKQTLLHILILLTVAALTGMRAAAYDSKTLLIINSYDENEPWVTDMIQPIVLYAASNADVDCEIYDLNNGLMTDSLDFANITKGLIDVYKDRQPDYVVMIGVLAFDMRRAIKEEWGDVPILLVTTMKDYVPLHEYFDADATSLNLSSDKHLSTQRDDYNFTAIIIPEFYKQTVDLMVRLMPKMDNLVFMSDAIFANRKLAHDIQNYLKEDYPEIKFSWLKASDKNAQVFHHYVIDEAPNTGLLLSSWLYAKHELTNWKTPTTNDLKLIAASRNPIFSLHEAYISLGVLGGVYPSTELAREKELEVVHAMINGQSMRSIPFFVCEDYYPCINYRLLQKYNINEELCPGGTVFYSKPATFWERYLWQSLALLLFVALIVIIMGIKNTQQGRKIQALNRNAEFVANMPIPYSTATIRYDTDNNVTTIAYDVKNAAFEKILNENVVPDSPFMLFPAKFIAPKVTQLLKTHKPQVFLYHFEKTDTFYEFILCLVNTIAVSKEKNVKSLDIFAIDITTRHKMEVRLASAMRTLDMTINTAKLVPWQYSVDRNTILYDYHMGDTSLDPSQNKSEILLDKFIEEEIHPDDRDQLRRARNDIRAGKIHDFNIKLRKINSEDPNLISWCEMTGTVTTPTEDNTQKVVIGSSLDITERVRAQEDMAVALERANESDRMKSAFLASMSHEIRTPLNAIVGFSNVIAHTDNPEERLEFCDIINKNNEQLLALINDVLDLAKIESNTIDINYAQTDVNNTIDHIEKAMALKVPQGIRFSAVKGSKTCVAELDEPRVTQILTNMISNSCKFTPTGSITFGYDITDSGMLYFYVRDTGIGISKENQQKVFDRFFKLNTFVPGTGLGLSICRNLVEKMGGEIGVESKGEGKGTMFWFTVPYVPSFGKIEDLNYNDDSIFRKYMMRLPVSKGRTRIKIMIAEDNESNYRLLEHLLHDHFELVRANNGNEAVRAFMREEPDLILMDISMPGMDGYTALKEIRKFSAKVPIIAVTAYIYASDRSKILEFGFDGYVSKPISQKTILDAIGHALLK